MQHDEEHVFIASPHHGVRLFLRHLPTRSEVAPRAPVLYVHGATFPSATSIAHRFDGHSWADALREAGFPVWGLDFQGYGLSDRFAAMDAPAEASGSLGRAEDASRQIEQAVRCILARHAVPRLSIVAHSWGTIAAGRFAARCPEAVERMVFFGPITSRPGEARAPSLPTWRLTTPQDQWTRFVADTPDGEPPVLLERHFRGWREAYLDGDPASRTRTPPSVQTPLGPMQDIAAAHAGDLAYDPARVRAPVCIVRGAWDSLCTDADAAWLFGALAASPIRRDVKIARAGHLMHLEENRYALYRETETFLSGGDLPPSD